MGKMQVTKAVCKVSESSKYLENTFKELLKYSKISQTSWILFKAQYYLWNSENLR